MIIILLHNNIVIVLAQLSNSVREQKSCIKRLFTILTVIIISYSSDIPISLLVLIDKLIGLFMNPKCGMTSPLHLFTIIAHCQWPTIVYEYTKVIYVQLYTIIYNSVT